MAEKTPTKKTTKKAPAKTVEDIIEAPGEPEARRIVHALDDAANPNGPVLCGKTAVEGVGNELDDDDVLCTLCAEALLARVNEYADTIDDMREALIDSMKRERTQRLQLAKKDRMILNMVERQFDADELGD